MKNAYLSFVNSLDLPGREPKTEYLPQGLLLHDTHGYRFAVSVSNEAGMLLCTLKDRSAFEGLSDYLSGTHIPGVTAYRDETPVPRPDLVASSFASAQGHAVFSTLITRGGITSRQTVFTFEGGIAVLGCGMKSAKDESAPMPVFETCASCCFADTEKMKVHKNTTTQGGLIYRTLMDDEKLVRHVRPVTPDGLETKRVFTLALQSSPAMPCYAYEITTVGMGYGCQILSNHEGCQAIMVQDDRDGKILSFNPAAEKLDCF